MHRLKMSNVKLAELTGYTPEYISMTLNGHRDSSNARERILCAISGEEEALTENSMKGA
jgi:hypothetical protein